MAASLLSGLLSTEGSQYCRKKWFSLKLEKCPVKTYAPNFYFSHSDPNSQGWDVNVHLTSITGEIL